MPGCRDTLFQQQQLPSKCPQHPSARGAGTSITFHATRDTEMLGNRIQSLPPRPPYCGGSLFTWEEVKSMSCGVVFSASGFPSIYLPHLPSALSGTSAGRERGGHASDWFFCLLPITYHGQKGMDSPLSMGTILYPSHSRVHSSPFSRAINVRGYGRTWFMEEKDERHIHLRVLTYSLVVLIPEPQNGSATYSNASLKDQSSDSGPYTE